MYFPDSRVESLRLSPKKFFALNKENQDKLLESFVDPESPEYYVPREWPDSPFQYLRSILNDEDEERQLLRNRIIHSIHQDTIRKALALMHFFRVEAFDMPALNPRALLIMKTFPPGCFGAHISDNRHLINPWLNWVPVSLLSVIYEIEDEEEFIDALALLPIEKFSISDFCIALETPLYHIRQSGIIDHQDPNIKLLTGRIETMFKLFQVKHVYRLDPDYPCLETLSQLGIYAKEVFALQAESALSFQYTIFDGRPLPHPWWSTDRHYRLNPVVKKQIFTVLCMQKWCRSQFPLPKDLLPMLFTMILHNHYDSLLPVIDELRKRNQHNSSKETRTMLDSTLSMTFDLGLAPLFPGDTLLPFNRALVSLGFPRVSEHIPRFEKKIVERMAGWWRVGILHDNLMGDRNQPRAPSNLHEAAKAMFEFCKRNRLYLSDIADNRCKFDATGYPIIEGMRRKTCDD